MPRTRPKKPARATTKSPAAKAPKRAKPAEPKRTPAAAKPTHAPRPAPVAQASTAPPHDDADTLQTGPPRFDDVDGLTPLFLMAPREPRRHWTLCLSDAHSPIELFESEGHSGNGYSWDSVARVAMAERGIDGGAIRFDSEGGTFVAQSESRDVLIALGRALVGLLGDESALRNAIRAVPGEDWDD
jgi:hypothetical protein